MTAACPKKSLYTEAEAAEALGVSVDELRRLVIRHVLKGEEEGFSGVSPTFQPSDLLVLRFLAAGDLNPSQQC